MPQLTGGVISVIGVVINHTTVLVHIWVTPEKREGGEGGDRGREGDRGGRGEREGDRGRGDGGGGGWGVKRGKETDKKKVFWYRLAS